MPPHDDVEVVPTGEPKLDPLSSTVKLERSRTDLVSVLRRSLDFTILSVFFVIYILFFLGTVDGRLGGDDHFAVSASPALLADDRLNIEVFDPGIPLRTMISFFGQAATGSMPLAEVVIALLFKLIGLTAVYYVTLRLAHSRIAAILVVATVALLGIHEPVYGAEKIALYPIAALASWRYLEGRLSPFVLSVIIVVAAGLRHDHGVFVAAGIALALCLGPQPLRSLVRTGGGVLLLMTPWLLWLHATEGVVTYFTSRAAFAMATGLGDPRPFGFLAPYLWEDNAARWLWHTAAFTMLAALIVGIRQRSVPVIVLAGMSIAAAFGLMRKDSQSAEVATMWIPLFVWLIRESAWHTKVALGGVAVVSLAAVLTMTRALEELPQIALESGGLRERARRAIAFHMVTPAIDVYAPVGNATEERLVIRYLYDCLQPSDRFWDTSEWFPASYYVQRRPVWHVHWQVPLRNDRVAQETFLTWIQQQQAPVIVTRDHDDPFEAFSSYPLVRAYVTANYQETTSERFEEFRSMGYGIRLLVDTRRRPTGRFAPLDLPCFSEPAGARP